MINMVTWMPVPKSELAKRGKTSKRGAASAVDMSQTALRHRLVTASEDGTCRVWDTVGLDPAFDVATSEPSVHSEPTASQLRGVASTATSLPAIASVALPHGATDIVTVVAHPTRSEVVTGCANGLAKVWYLDGGVFTLRGGAQHQHRATYASFSFATCLTSVHVVADLARSCP